LIWCDSLAPDPNGVSQPGHPASGELGQNAVARGLGRPFVDALGEGVIDFAQLFAQLRSAGYDGFLSVEYVHQAYMNTLGDDVLTETIAMRDLARAHGIA